jgi:hypothetical protein
MDALSFKVKDPIVTTIRFCIPIVLQGTIFVLK